MSNILQVKSSLIEEIEYLEDSSVLRIKFHKYMYDELFYKNVPLEVYTGLFLSKSKGKYYLENIHKKFLFTTKKPCIMATDKKSQMIKVKINLTKINKDWLFQGEKGTYLDATLWFTEEQDDNGNNGMITQDVPKAIWEKDKQVRGTILGNGKVWGARPAITAEEKVGSTEGLTKASDEALDDLPF